MDIQTSDNITTIGDEFPFYEQDTPTPDEQKEKVSLDDVPQGASSSLNSDTIDGFNAVTATAAGPNKLVATDNTGKLPTSIIPTVAATTGLVFVSTASPSAASTVTFSGLDSSTTYFCIFNLTKNTDGLVGIDINASGGTTHEYYHNYTDSGGNHIIDRTITTSNIGLAGTTAVGTTKLLVGNFYLQPNGTTTFLSGFSFLNNSAATRIGLALKGKYDSASLSSFNFTCSAGTITGTIKLYKVL